MTDCECLRRVTACVKHCTGFPTEVIEAGPDMEELVDGWSHKSVLVSAAEQSLEILDLAAANNLPVSSTGITVVASRLREAIAREKGITS